MTCDRCGQSILGFLVMIISTLAFIALLKDDPEPISENGEVDEDEVKSRLEDIGYL